MKISENLELKPDEFRELDADALFEDLGPWLLEWLYEEVGQLYAEIDGIPERYEDMSKSPTTDVPYSFRIAGSIYALWTEIGNGGLHQYFYNFSIGLPHVIEGLNVLGRKKAAELLLAACETLPKSKTRLSQNDWRVFLDKPSNRKKLDALDDDIWAAIRHDTLMEDLAEFVRHHRHDFEPHLAA